MAAPPPCRRRSARTVPQKAVHRAHRPRGGCAGLSSPLVLVLGLWVTRTRSSPRPPNGERSAAPACTARSLCRGAEPGHALGPRPLSRIGADTRSGRIEAGPGEQSESIRVGLCRPWAERQWRAGRAQGGASAPAPRPPGALRRYLPTRTVRPAPSKPLQGR